MRKILIFFLIFLLLGTCFITRGATPYFTDTNEHWAEEYTETLRKIGIMNGTDNKVNTETYITRGEFAALITRMLYEPDYENYDLHFDDVDMRHIFAPYIALAYEKGIVNGIDDTTFMPDNFITREQIVLMLSRLDILKDRLQTVDFTDITTDYKYYKEISTCVSNDILSGYSDKTFRPLAFATRAETAAMLVRTLKSADIASYKSKLADFADRYFEYDTSDVDSAVGLAIGQAYDDLTFRTDVLSNSDVSFVKAKYTDVLRENTSVDGMLSEVVYSCKGEFETDTYNKSYDVTVRYNIINKGGEFYVYNIDKDYAVPEKINLTWEVYNSAPSYSTPGVTHVSPSGFELSSVKTSGVANDIGLKDVMLYNNISESYVDYAKSNGYDIWAMYKTDFKTLTANKVLNDADIRRGIIQYIAGQCVNYGITGINFDFENMLKADRDAFSNHVREMEIVMHEIGVIVSADITRYEKTSDQWSMCYDRNKLSEYADYIMLMAYDQYYAGSKVPGPVGGLSWVEDSIRLTLNEVPNEKVVLGMPFYTRYWECKNGQVVSTKAISMEFAIKLIKENNPELVYVEKDGQHKAVWSKNGIEYSFWFETAETIGKRVKLANKYNLAGVASWRRGFETGDVWTVIQENL